MAYMTPREAEIFVEKANSSYVDPSKQLNKTSQAQSDKMIHKTAMEEGKSSGEIALGNVGSNILASTAIPVSDLFVNTGSLLSSTFGDGEFADEQAVRQGNRERDMWGLSPHMPGQVDPKSQHNLVRDLVGFMAPNKAFDVGVDIAGEIKTIAGNAAKRHSLGRSLKASRNKASPLFNDKINASENLRLLKIDYDEAVLVAKNNTSPSLQDALDSKVIILGGEVKKAQKNYRKATKARETNIDESVGLGKKRDGVGATTLNDDAATVLGQEAKDMSVGGNLKKEALDFGKRTLRHDIVGTVPMIDTYSIDETGDISTKSLEDWKSEFREMMTANAAFSAAATGISTGMKANKAVKSRAVVNERADLIEGSKKQKINLTEETLNDYAATTSKQYKGKKEIKGDANLEKVHNSEYNGVFKTNDGAYIMSSPKLGTMKLYKDKNGEFYTKSKDKNVFTEEGLTLPINFDGMSKYVIEPRGKKFEEINSQSLGINSIKTVKVDIDEEGNVIFSSSKNKFNKDVDIAELKNAQERIKQNYGLDDMITQTTSDVKVTTSAVQRWVNIALSDKNLDVTKLKDPTVKNAIFLARKVEDKANTLFDKDFVENNIIYPIRQAINDTLTASKSNNVANPINNLIKTISKELGDTTQKTKAEFNDMLSFAVKENLLKLASKIQKDDKGGFYLPAKDSFSFTGAVLESAMDMAGLSKRGPEIEGFIKQLRGNAGIKFETEMLFGELSNKIHQTKDIMTEGFPIEKAGKDTVASPFTELIKNAKAGDVAKEASSSVERHVYGLGSAVNISKQSIDYSANTVIQPQKIGGALDMSKLDNKSYPISSAETTGSLYNTMGGSIFKYRANMADVKKQLNSILSLTDIQLAKYMDIDGITDTAKSLEDNLVTFESIQEAKDSMRGVRQEAKEHLFAAGKYDDNVGVTFDIMKVPTNRMQYTGFINPQQGFLSKAMFTITGKSMPDGVTKTEFYTTGLRTALDEHPELLNAVDPKLLKSKYAIDIDSIADFDLKKWNTGLELELALDIQKGIELNPGKVELLTLDSQMAARTVKAIVDDKPAEVIAEIDGATNMKGMTDSMLKIESPDTGINALLKDADGDIYSTFQKDVETVFGKLGLKRADVKTSVFGGTYGMDASNVAKQLVAEFINKQIRSLTDPALRDIALDNLSRIAKEVKSKKNLSGNLSATMKKLEAKIAKEVQADEILSKYYNQKTAKGESVKSVLFNSVDSVESVAMKLDHHIADLFKEFRDLHVAQFIQKVESAVGDMKGKSGTSIPRAIRNILKEDVERIAEIASRDKISDVRGALDNAMGKKAVEFKGGIEKLFERGYQAHEISMGNRATESLRKSIMKELRVNGVEKKNIETMFASRTSPTLGSFLEELHRVGYNSLQSRTVTSLIPGFRNVFGDKVNYVNMKGVGFDKDTHMTYQTFAPIDNPLPFVLHSTDSSLVGLASRSETMINHRWDAVLDHNSPQLGNELNMYVGYMYGKSNIGTKMSDAFKEQDAIFNRADSSTKDAIRRDMARKRVLLRGQETTLENINAEKLKIDNSLADVSTVDKYISKLERDLKGRNKDIENGGDITIQQYSDQGRLKTNVTKADLDSMKESGISTVIRPEITMEMNLLKKVEPESKVVNPLHEFEMMSVSKKQFIKDIQEMGVGKDSAYNTVAQAITTKYPATDVRFWEHYAHEGIHAITMKIMNEVAVAKEFRTLKIELAKKGISILKDGKKTTTKLVTEEATLEGKGISKMNTRVIYGNELAANMLDNLLANELIYVNKDMISNMSGKTNLEKFIKPLELYDKNTRDTIKIYNMNEFKDFLRANDVVGHMDTLDSIGEKFAGMTNGSSVVRDMMFNKNIDPFNTTIRNVGHKMKGRKEQVKAIHQKIADIPFLELFELNPTKEALLKAVGYKNGATGIIETMVAEATESILKDLESKFGGDFNKYSKNIGDALSLGLNKLMFENMESRFGYLNIDKSVLFGSNKKSLPQLKLEFKDAKERIFRDLTKKSDNSVIKKEFDSIMNGVEILSKGGTAVRLIDVAGRLEKFAKPHMSKKQFSVFNSKLMVQKLASMDRLTREPGQLDKLTDLIAKDYEGFRGYLEAANTHSNPYSLFGENIEFQFLENGKEGRIVDAGKDVNPEDVIATVVDDAGNQVKVISVDASERLIASQDSNLMTINITDFEKGIYNNKGVHLNAQNIELGTSNIDNGIHKQIARNMYIKIKDEMSKDLGYRQWHLLREAGVYMTRDEMQAVQAISDQREFVKIGDSNPHARIMGNDFYIDKRYSHILNGTEGIDLVGVGKFVGGDTHFAKTVTAMSKVIYDGTKVMRNLILVARPSSYINSFVSSMGIYWMMKEGGTNAIKGVNLAKDGIESYRKTLQKYAREYSAIDPKNPAKNAKQVEDAWKAVKKHQLHAAMEAGLVNTIRADAYKIGSLPELGMYKAIRHATGSHGHANALKTMGLDPSTPVGAKLGTIFDSTELLPKIALYMNLLENGRSAEYAIQKTMMSFPTYQNLPHFLNMVDQVSPYTKFFASTPRMILYGLNQGPIKMGVTAIMANSLPAASFMFASEEEQAKWDYYKENDYIKAPFLPVAYSSTSLFPTVTNPFSTPFGNTPFDVGFLAGAIPGMFDASTYLPGTYMNK